MKRKRGKKGKSKKAPKLDITEADPDIVNLSNEDISGPDDTDKEETNSIMDVETPSSTGTDQPEKTAAVGSTGVINKPVGGLVYNRVKVKIKPSKALEPQLNSSDAHTHSDTDKSSQHVGVDKQVVSDRVEDSANSVPESNLGVPMNQAKKPGSIKIKPSKGFSSTSLSPCNNVGMNQVERVHQKEPESLRRDSVYNKQELNTSLEVIKKIMKMDAAEPFNVPVNPVALGIPDYFDVIKTPMDFGTICSNLESGVKYMNSKDVYKDVQYIWENCYKYNNKGDYIMDLMKRVKKNFSKYWAAAGLYSEQQQGNSGDTKDANSSHGKMSSKGGHLKHKSQKRHGVKRHKDGCLCAICVMMRRRQEREGIAHSGDDQTDTSDGRVQENKPEGTSAGESPNGDDTSSSIDNSQNQDADGDMEEEGEEVKLEDTKDVSSDLQGKQEGKDREMPRQTNGKDVIGEHSQLDDRSGTDKPEEIIMAEAGNDLKKDTSIEEKPLHHEDETVAVEHQKHKRMQDVSEKAKMYENLRQRYENPMLLELCGTLFAGNPKSVWSGPHSITHRQDPSCNRPIHAAFTTLMKW